jgi:tetratricopeptide (TPR) repeat protein
MSALKRNLNSLRQTSKEASTVQMKKMLRARSWMIGVSVLAFVFGICLIGRAQQKASKNSADFAQAAGLLQQGRLREAKTATLDELQHHPSSVEGYNLLGIINTKQQDYSGALESFKKALHIAPNSVKTFNNIGNVYVAIKDFDSAEKAFRMALHLEPADQDGNYNLGVLLMMRGSAAEAVPHFERVRPRNLQTRFNLVRAYFEIKRNADALREASELSEQGKNDVQVHFSLGGLLASEKQYKPAQLEFEKADALEPGTFEILYNLGLALFRETDNEKAEVALNRALRLKPDSTDALYLLAQIYRNESRPLDALNLLIRAHKIAPENVDIALLMAQVSISQQFYEDAIPLLESGLKIAPQRADLCAALGQSYFMSGKIDKAVEEFKRLIELEPSARSYAFVALSYRSLGRFDEAKEYVQRGLKLDPHSSACLANLGFIAEAQGDAADAEKIFQQILRTNPNFPDALLELANFRIAAKRFLEAADLLREYIRVGHNPATGYYKLAIVERNLHQKEAAERDLSKFQTLSNGASSGPLPFQDLFDFLNSRSELDPNRRTQLDIADLTDEIKKHPDQPQDLYFLAEAYLKSGNIDDARSTIAALDKVSSGDYKTVTGAGVLLARYHLYDDAIQHFQAALKTNPDSDEIKFDLANACFRKRSYPEALEAAGQVSAEGRKDDAYLALLGDIYAHMGDAVHASEVFHDAIARNPDDDQNYLALSLLEFRDGDIAEAKQTLMKGQARIPGSGKILWGLGLASALEGSTSQAAGQLERAVDLIPEWPGSYSLLGVFYFETGQIDKAREILDRFKNSSASGTLDVNRIEQFLAQAPAVSPTGNEPMTMENRKQLLELALSLADRTL